MHFSGNEKGGKDIADQTKSMAKFAKVPVECVRVISKEEYDINIDDED